MGGMTWLAVLQCRCNADAMPMQCRCNTDAQVGPGLGLAGLMGGKKAGTCVSILFFG